MEKGHMKKIPRQYTKTILAGAGAAILVVSGICSAIRRSCHKKKIESKQQKEESCPFCGGMIIGNHRNSMKCTQCEIVFQRCDACQKLYHGYANFCPYCGIESKKKKTVTVNGTTYKIMRQEPFQQGIVFHTFCSCGTPFTKDGNYCQFCGNKRAKPGRCYLKEIHEVRYLQEISKPESFASIKDLNSDAD